MSESLHYTYLALTYYVHTYNMEGWKVFPRALHYYYRCRQPSYPE